MISYFLYSSAGGLGCYSAGFMSLFMLKNHLNWKVQHGLTHMSHDGYWLRLRSLHSHLCGLSSSSKPEWLSKMVISEHQSRRARAEFSRHLQAQALEVLQCHFCHILLVQESHRSSADSKKWKNRPTLDEKNGNVTMQKDMHIGMGEICGH